MNLRSLKSAVLRRVPYILIDALQTFLEDQTEGLVQSIQSLQASVRDDSYPAVVRGHLNSVASIVGKMVSGTQKTTLATNNGLLREQADPLVEKLAVCGRRVKAASAESQQIDDLQTWTKFKETLAPLGFDIARETKELVQRLDQFDDQ